MSNDIIDEDAAPAGPFFGGAEVIGLYPPDRAAAASRLTSTRFPDGTVESDD